MNLVAGDLDTFHESGESLREMVACGRWFRRNQKSQ